MDLINSLILIIIVIILIILFVSQPLAGGRRPVVQDSQALSTLLAERDRVLNILKELDFDASLGKIPVETYSVQRASLVQQGAEILRKIDQLTPVPAVTPAVAAEDEDRVDAILSARRARQAGSVAREEDKAESLVASRRQVQSGKSGRFCSQCGRALATTDRFCPSCGQPVQ